MTTVAAVCGALIVLTLLGILCVLAALTTAIQALGSGDESEDEHTARYTIRWQ